MHNWSDGDKVDWKSIGEASYWIPQQLRRYGRMFAHGKEKYGRVDVSVMSGCHTYFELLKPGWVYCSWPKWVRALDYRVSKYTLRPLHRIVNWYQSVIYRMVYRAALKKWPLIREEILNGADQWHLLEEHGCYVIRDSARGYTRYLAWNPLNWSARSPETEETN